MSSSKCPWCGSEDFFVVREKIETGDVKNGLIDLGNFEVANGADELRCSDCNHLLDLEHVSGEVYRITGEE